MALPGAKNLKQGKTFLDILRNAHVMHFSLRTLKNLLGKNGWKFVAGDEEIKSIFTPVHGETFKIESDYSDETEYLKRAERNRLFNFIFYKKILNPIKLFVYKIRNAI